MTEQESPFLEKARQSLAGAESEFAAGRYDNCANRLYDASFQAAIAALQRAGIQARGGEWSHAYVPSQFEGILINRRKRYPAELRTVLARNFALRITADYDEDVVTQTEAARALRRTGGFVAAIEHGGNGTR